MAEETKVTNLPDAGLTQSGQGDLTTNIDGALSEGLGRQYVPDLYLDDVDKIITRIRPMSTPIDQISRYAKSSSTNSSVVKYYSVGTRPIKCQVKEAVAKMTDGISTVLKVNDASMFTKDDTIRVVGVNGITKADGTAYDSNSTHIPDLVLKVCEREKGSNNITVFAINGYKDETTGQTNLVPNIPAGTTLIRMGKTCTEKAAQTGRFTSIPTPQVQYCQKFMAQVEQTNLDATASKEVNWNLTDIEEDAIYDMRMTMENSFLFGVARQYTDLTDENGLGFCTGGIWDMAGKDIEVGHWDTAKNDVVINDNDLVNISKDLFKGTDTGGKRKVLFCGSDMLAALSKIESDKFRLKDTVEVWNLRFKSWQTDFGEILTMPHELFDQNGMAQYGFALDPIYLSKRVRLPFTRGTLNLDTAGIRDVKATIFKEISCVFLRYPQAHARLQLAQKPTTGGDTVQGE